MLYLNSFTRIASVEELRDEIYEVDADPERIDEEMSRSQADTITKQGYLMKGPETSSDRMFAHIGSKSFKRRYFTLFFSHPLTKKYSEIMAQKLAIYFHVNKLNINCRFSPSFVTTSNMIFQLPHFSSFLSFFLK